VLGDFLRPGLVSLGGKAKKSFDKHLAFLIFFPLDFSGEVSLCI
jgi:hypothetical protein